MFLSSPIPGSLGPVGFNKVIRVLAVDQNSLMREGLSLLVRLQPDMQLVGAAAMGEEALQMYIEQRPDVTLMDLDLPSQAAIGAIRKIRARDAGARIIGLTTYEPDAAWAEALAAGASQWIAKDGLSDSLPRLIRNEVPPVPPENGG
ncbi:MAG: response regulator transcription factor [Bryobacteraceae bacterium]